MKLWMEIIFSLNNLIFYQIRNVFLRNLFSTLLTTRVCAHRIKLIPISGLSCFVVLIIHFIIPSNVVVALCMFYSMRDVHYLYHV